MRSVQRLIYSLKNRYGQSVDFYQEIDSPPNILTGKIIKSRVKYNVRKAIVLYEKMDALSTFVTKTVPIVGLIETNNTQLLIDGKDFPKDFNPQLNDYVVSNKDKYQVAAIRYIDNGQAYHIILKEFKGSQIPQIFNVNIHDKLTIIQVLKYHNIKGTHHISIVQNLSLSQNIITSLQDLITRIYVSISDIIGFRQDINHTIGLNVLILDNIDFIQHINYILNGNIFIAQELILMEDGLIEYVPKTDYKWDSQMLNFIQDVVVRKN